MALMPLNATRYVGGTSSLIRRVAVHRQEVREGFTKGYGMHKRAWYETHGTLETAILREKQIRKRDRRARLRPIVKGNPEWRDLWVAITSASPKPGPRHFTGPGLGRALPG